MRILFDNGVPRGLAALLSGHDIEEARNRGWDTLFNCFLIQEAESAGFDVLLTNDNQIQYQQNLKERRIAIVVLTNSQWPAVRQAAPQIAVALLAATPNSYIEIVVPFLRRSNA